jgi:hypothetical protein
MTKIPYEDRTQPPTNEQNFKVFCAKVCLFVVSKALEMGFTFRDIAVSMFKMGEDLVNYGKLTGDIEEDDIENIRKEAIDLAGSKLEEVESEGIADVIRKYAKK